MIPRSLTSTHENPAGVCRIERRDRAELLVLVIAQELERTQAIRGSRPGTDEDFVDAVAGEIDRSETHAAEEGGFVGKKAVEFDEAGAVRLEELDVRSRLCA